MVISQLTTMCLHSSMMSIAPKTEQAIYRQNPPRLESELAPRGWRGGEIQITVNVFFPESLVVHEREGAVM